MTDSIQITVVTILSNRSVRRTWTVHVFGRTCPHEPNFGRTRSFTKMNWSRPDKITSFRFIFPIESISGYVTVVKQGDQNYHMFTRKIAIWWTFRIFSSEQVIFLIHRDSLGPFLFRTQIKRRILIGQHNTQSKWIWNHLKWNGQLRASIWWTNRVNIEPITIGIRPIVILIGCPMLVNKASSLVEICVSPWLIRVSAAHENHCDTRTTT